MKEPAELSNSAKLRVARAWMAEHGFSPHASEVGSKRRCFIGTFSAVGYDSFPMVDLLRPHLKRHLPLWRRLLWLEFPNFSDSYLIRNKFDTDKALAVFDAAIAKAEKKEARTTVK